MEMTISISASVFFSHFFFPFSNSPLQMKRCFSSDLNPCVPFVSLILLPLGHFDPQTSSEHITTVMLSPLVFFFLFSCFSSRKKKKTWRRVFKCVLYIFYPHFLTSRLLLSFFHLSYLFQSPKPPLQRVTNDLSPLDFLILSPVSP